MDDVLTETPPPSRFFEEDLDNFAAPSPLFPSPLLVLNPNPNPSFLRPSLLVVAISSPSLALLHRIPSKSLIGTLILPEITLSGNPLNPSPRDRSCRIYAAGESAVLVAVQLPVSADRSRSVAKCLMGEIRPGRLIVLDSIRGQNYRGRLSADEALAFKLETSEQRRGGDPVVRDVEYLPSGTVMDGLGAAILAECQMKKGKGTLCATWPKSVAVPILRSLLLELGLDVAAASDVITLNKFSIFTFFGLFVASQIHVPTCRSISARYSYFLFINQIRKVLWARAVRFAAEVFTSDLSSSFDSHLRENPASSSSHCF